MTDIKRKIYFYQIDSGLDSKKRPISFDPVPSLSHIGKLDFNFKGRYLHDEGKIICCWVDSYAMPCKIRLCSIRRKNLPQIETQGEITPLEIPENSGLLEATHIVFFGNDVIGCDYNFYGPKVSKLPFYLAEKAIGIAPPLLNIIPILRKDVLQQLQKMRDLRMFRLKIRAPFAENIKSINHSLYEAFHGGIVAGGADEIELILRASKRSGILLLDNLIQTAKELIGQPEIQFESSKFVIDGYNPEKSKLESLDLLSDRFIVNTTVSRASIRSKAANPKSVYAAITLAYEDLKEELSTSMRMAV